MCNGDAGSRWSNTAANCVTAPPNSICDSLNHTTCHIARVGGILLEAIQNHQTWPQNYPLITTNQILQADEYGAIIRESNNTLEYVSTEWSNLDPPMKVGDVVLEIDGETPGQEVYEDLYLKTDEITWVLEREGETLEVVTPKPST